MSLARTTTPGLPLDAGAYLRPLVESDVTTAYVDGLNDPVVNRFLVGPRMQRQSKDTVIDFVRANFEDPEAILFGIFVDDVLRGTSRLHDVRNRTAFLGIALFDRTVWGRGLARKTIRAICDYATTNLDVAEIQAGIEDENTASARAFHAAGFRPWKSAAESNAKIWVWKRQRGFTLPQPSEPGA